MLEPDGGLDSLPMAIAAYLIIGGGACHLAASTMKEDCVEAPALSARLLWSAMISGHHYRGRDRVWPLGEGLRVRCMPFVPWCDFWRDYFERGTTSHHASTSPHRAI